MARTFMLLGIVSQADMNVLTVLLEAIDGFRDGGATEAISEGVEEVAEQETGREL
ncbi:hypothetical protein SAMN05192554_106187 [Haloarchaeobius iranensis]|uniref:Uncharacterized protein n=1 Tax=Haloarchaeobius iranensis TaxID=996166 RepID=A0A1G9VM42_9EURY|nr:hypothetical protein SAMN05192554_106187 [Haloarchaeobius iranensis]